MHQPHNPTAQRVMLKRYEAAEELVLASDVVRILCHAGMVPTITDNERLIEADAAYAAATKGWRRQVDGHS